MIERLGHRLSEAIKLAYEEAQQLILEPSAPRRPDLLMELGELAATLILTYATRGLGAHLGAIGRVIDRKVGASLTVGKYATRQVGAKMARDLLAGFNAGGTLAVEGAMTTASKHSRALPLQEPSLERKPEDAKLSARSVYLKAARRGTVDRTLQIDEEFSKSKGELKRLPVDTLQAISSSFGPSWLEDIKREFKGIIVREWVNFGKRAMEHGEEVRDDAHRHPTRPSSTISSRRMVWCASS